MFGLQMASHLAWISGSVGGAFFGSLIDPKGYGLPFALPALFICLLVFQVKSLHHFWMMVIAGISSLFFRWAFRGDWYILVATLLVSGIGVAMNSKGQSPRLEGERE
jgi:predicted branched-subunit amino acid permease